MNYEATLIEKILIIQTIFEYNCKIHQPSRNHIRCHKYTYVFRASMQSQIHHLIWCSNVAVVV